jgi:hypothetical protein
VHFIQKRQLSKSREVKIALLDVGNHKKVSVSPIPHVRLRAETKSKILRDHIKKDFVVFVNNLAIILS